MIFSKGALKFNKCLLDSWTLSKLMNKTLHKTVNSKTNF